MQSDRYFKIVQLQNTWASTLCASSYNFDPPNKNLVFDSQKHKRFLFGFEILTLLFLFIFIRTLNHITGFERFATNHYYFLSCVSIAAMACWLILFLVAWKSQELALGFNEFVRFFENIQKTYIPTHNNNTCFSNLLLDVIALLDGPVFIILALVISLHAILFHNWPIYFSSIFPANTPKILYIINAIYCLWITQYLYATLLILATVFIGFGPHLLTIFKELIVNTDGDGRPMLRFQMANKHFRAAENLQKTYRQLQIIQGFEMEVLAWSIIPLQGLMCYLIMYCTVSLIKNRDEMDVTLIIILVLWAALSTVDTFLLLNMSAKIYVITKRALKSMKKRNWGTKMENKIMGKFLKSCQPLSVGYGKAYVIKKRAVLKFIKFIAKGTFRALLSIK